MRGRLAFVVLIAGLALSGCMNPWVDNTANQGYVHVVINPGSSQIQSLEPKLIPNIADSVRIRVWHEASGFNALATIHLNGAAQDVNIPVPEGTGYTVDAVSYYMKGGRAMALTGGRAVNVNVAAKAVTNVAVNLRAWDTDTAGDTVVEPEKMYTVEFIASDAGGLLTDDTFKGATLHTSTTDFQNTATALPLFPQTAAVQADNRFTFSAYAPNVTAVTTLYTCALVEFVQNWRDTSLLDLAEQTLYLELPNRHMGEDLHEITIDPSAGGLIVEITGR
jgi:hypothetical protein